jgi:predicted type IV restriction endonuclease
MAKQKLDPEVRKNILKAQRWIADIVKKDANENETRTRIYNIFGMLMGYDCYEHITQEYAIQTAGETTHCDLAIQIKQGESSKPDLLIEIKKVNIDLVSRHIRQAASYAIDIGCEWVLLTNSKDWKLYHISFEKPPQTMLVDSWNIISDAPSVLADKFSIICYKNIKRDGLSRLWEKSNVLTAQNILKVILSEQSITSIRSKLKRATGVTVSPEELIGAVRRMLNEAAVGEMEKIKILLPDKKPKKKPASIKESVPTVKIKQEVKLNGH